MRSGWIRTAAVAILIAVAAGAYVLFLAPPSIPASAGSTEVATTVLDGEIAPDMLNEDGAEVPPASPAGQACLERIENGSGWLDLCWAAERNPLDSDQQKDYYLVRAYGTYQSTSVLGIRWLVAQATVAEPPLGGVMDGWPSGTADGPCSQQDVTLMAMAAPWGRRCSAATRRPAQLRLAGAGASNGHADHALHSIRRHARSRCTKSSPSSRGRSPSGRSQPTSGASPFRARRRPPVPRRSSCRPAR